MVNTYPVNIEELGSGIGTKRAAAAIAFGDAVERRNTYTVGVHMEKVIDNCQVAWTGKTDVTATAEAGAKKVNTLGTKLVIDTTFTTGLVATRDFTAIDLSFCDTVGFWMNCSTVQAAGVFSLVFSEVAACASATEAVPIPALAAGVWRYVKSKIPAVISRDAIISVGLYANSDPVTPTIYLDDIRAGNDFLGIADEDQAKDSYATHDPVHIITDGKAMAKLVETAYTGQYLVPVGNGKFAKSTQGEVNMVGLEGQRTVTSRAMAIEDQTTSNGACPVRMV